MVVGTLIAGMGLGWLIGRALADVRPPRPLQPVRVNLPQRRRVRT
jgi:hypothetical protein